MKNENNEKGPLFLFHLYMRTWSGTYVKPALFPAAIMGWIRYGIFKLYEWWKGEKCPQK